MIVKAIAKASSSKMTRFGKLIMFKKKKLFKKKKRNLLVMIRIRLIRNRNCRSRWSKTLKKAK
jgi:hypothetical protein